MVVSNEYFVGCPLKKIIRFYNSLDKLQCSYIYNVLCYQVQIELMRQVDMFLILLRAAVFLMNCYYWHDVFIMYFLLQLGCALGFLIPPEIVGNIDDVEFIRYRLMFMFYGGAVLTTALFILVVLCMFKCLLC